MLIAIPSKGRAGLTTSQKILSSAVFYVPEGEVKAYEEQGLEVVGVPNEIKGITPTRNWILDNTKERWVVMVDDDVKNAGWRELLPHQSKQRKLKEKDFMQCYADAFKIIEWMGWKIWGAKTEGALRSCYPCKPFVFKTYITASCMGIINDGSYRFDERFVVKEDYEIGLRHIKEFNGVLGVRYWYWENSHWTDDGGCKQYRTSQVEKKAIQLLKSLYPGIVKIVNRGGCEYSVELRF